MWTRTAAPIMLLIALSGCVERRAANDPPAAEVASSPTDDHLSAAEAGSELRMEDPVKLD